ncbi:hypothetical protein CC79DRAFT_1315974 [Sarocladium strictum]
MHPSLILIVASSTLTLAALNPLSKRQSQIPCEDLFLESCGNVCIDLTDTCCPDGSGGCPLGSNCEIGDNGEYGCCPIGENCVGDGGARTEFEFGTLTEPPPVDEPTDFPEVPDFTTSDFPEIPDFTSDFPELPSFSSEFPEIPEFSSEVVDDVPEETVTVPGATVSSPGDDEPTTTSGETEVTDAANVPTVGMNNLLGGLIGAAVLLL